MRKLWVLVAMFLAGLGIVIGTRMSTEAMGVAVGVVLGVAGSIPMSLLIMMFVSRREKRAEEPRNAAYPPVVIVTPNGSPHQNAPMPYLPPAQFNGAAGRAFTVVGEDDMYGLEGDRSGGWR